MKRFFHVRELRAEHAASGKRYLEFLRVPAISTGIYVLPKEGEDRQTPHKQDEIYYVISGRARMKITRDHESSRETSEDRLVTQGTVIFVEAGTEHRFHSIEEELVVLVVFGPAETES
jgi:mannose-6-phosphate isomerase-like protein (cupin superfamily)